MLVRSPQIACMSTSPSELSLGSKPMGTNPLGDAFRVACSTVLGVTEFFDLSAVLADPLASRLRESIRLCCPER